MTIAVISDYEFEMDKPPSYSMIKKFVNDVQKWLGISAAHVAAVQCSDGIVHHVVVLLLT